VEIGSYPSIVQDGFSLSLVLRATDEKPLKAATDKLVAMIKRRGDEPSIAYQRPPAPQRDNPGL